MKKVLLLTWYDNQNYGTALQAWALKSVIESPDITGLNKINIEETACVILPHSPERDIDIKKKLKKVFSLKSYSMKIEQLRDKIEREKKKKCFQLRQEAFDKFIEEQFLFAANCNLQTVEQLTTIVNEFDVFIAGSDQIWNPEGLDETYLLNWVPQSKKICSYGSSLSVKRIPLEYEDIYRKTLSRFSCISIRDTSCKAQLSQLSGKPVQTVVDPVILIGQDAIKKKVKKCTDKPYIFCYFLGNNKSHRTRALQYAEEHGMDVKAVINAGCSFKSDRELEQYAIWNVDPWGFINLIGNAEAIMTDSFHATVISAMLHRQFYTYEKDAFRPEQNNRIIEFLTMIGLENRWNCPTKDEINITVEDWKEVDNALSTRRSQSMEYLMEVLG